MTGAEIIMQVLVDEGVDTLFGYSGGAILPAYDALYRHNESCPEDERLRLVVGANEQGAGFMAAGYARASGRVGVLMVTSGPGATNCVTPVRDSMADSVPMVVISGQVARAAIGTDAFQEAPVYNIMGACAKHVFLVEDEQQVEATLRTAFAIARSGRPGPVIVDVPKDVQNYEGVFRGGAYLEFRGYGQRVQELMTELDPSEAEAFYALLGQSKRPLLYVGGGVVAAGAAPELREFANRFSIPVVSTLMGLGGFDTTDPLSLRMLGMHGTAYGNYAVLDCDFLIAVGARFDDRVVGNVAKFAPGAKIAHFDIDPAEIGKVKTVAWSHVGDAKVALGQLLDAADAAFKPDFGPWVRRCAKLKRAHRLRYATKKAEIQPEFVIDTLNQLTRGDAVVCTGVGQHQMFSALYFDFREPRTFLTSGCMGTMGFGLPSAIGAQLACPDRLVIDVDGDGSMRMNIGELETAVTYGVPIKVLLLNNRADGMVWQWQDIYYGRRFSGTDKTARTKDFVKEAQANGFQFARRVTSKAQVRRALKNWLAFDGPAFLEVMTDRDAYVYPMVGPGLGYQDMDLGPNITGRDVR
ncbi:MAG TPA: biosynthetic-type acetolactate synthase large subunit [Candidatus Hydrogenedentes bacterium]|nr:biosynthetic-type acetolactate synthase large subunit [Candidatus Hydrogenedentota bacterium]HPG69585.1 biosynthetic-type acetolactate synthase large subunit [Candidatus Hydrogenedentota bacterium]